jgi:hypothetical protein
MSATSPSGAPGKACRTETDRERLFCLTRSRNVLSLRPARAARLSTLSDMKVKHTGILAALAISLLATSACERKVTSDTAVGRVLEVQISLISPGQCDVDYPLVNLRRNLSHRLKWISDDGQYTILFQQTPPGPNPGPGTPFQDSHGNPQYSFTVPAGGDVKTGIPVVYGNFVYTINDANNRECKNADPGVNIKR